MTGLPSRYVEFPLGDIRCQTVIATLVSTAGPPAHSYRRPAGRPAGRLHRLGRAPLPRMLALRTLREVMALTAYTGIETIARAVFYNQSIPHPWAIHCIGAWTQPASWKQESPADARVSARQCRHLTNAFQLRRRTLPIKLELTAV